MLGQRMRRTIAKNADDFRGLVLRAYPGWVLGDEDPPADEPPAFVFHDVQAPAFERILRFLQVNGYRTLTADEYVARRTGQTPGNMREVMLTFDDGLKSLYSVAFPLLERYGHTAVAYVVPGVVTSTQPERAGAVLHEKLCSWQELRHMHAAGVVDVQSHSLHHGSIAVGRRALDFFHPGVARAYLDSDLTLSVLDPATAGDAGVLPFGTPIYAWRPRLAAAPAYTIDPSVARACVGYVEDRGGAAFFQRPRWRAELHAVLTDMQAGTAQAVRETPAAQRAAIRRELSESRRLLEMHLPGKQVRHFCYPWYSGSPLSVAMTAELGYRSSAWGGVLPAFTRHGPQQVHIRRLQPHFIWRLPGAGRRPVWQVEMQRFGAGGAG